MSPTVPVEAPGGATQLGSSTARLPSPREASGRTMRCHHHAPSNTSAPCTKTTFIPSTSPPTLVFLRTRRVASIWCLRGVLGRLCGSCSRCRQHRRSPYASLHFAASFVPPASRHPRVKGVYVLVCSNSPG